MRILILKEVPSLTRVLNPVFSKLAEVMTVVRTGRDVHLDIDEKVANLSFHAK